MKKLSSKRLVKARENKFVKVWRASGNNSTLIANPNLQQLKDRPDNAEACEKYVRLMCFEVSKKEMVINDGGLLMRTPTYFINRYDMTAIEVSILRNIIFNKNKDNGIN